MTLRAASSSVIRPLKTQHTELFGTLYQRQLPPGRGETSSANPIDVVEALLFASDVPLEADRIREVLDLESADAAHELVASLTARYDEHARGLAIMEVAGGYRMVTRPELAPWLVRLARARTRVRLSRPGLETLAIIAYKQPVSRPEIDAVRGVNSEATLDNLLERRLVRIAARKEAPGRPFVYETTREFLIAFGLRDSATCRRSRATAIPVMAAAEESMPKLRPTRSAQAG